MTEDFTEYKPSLTRTIPPINAYIAMWSDTLGLYTPESYKGILGRYSYEPYKQEAPTLLYTEDGKTLQNRTTGEIVGILTERKIGKFYHWHFQGVEVDGKKPKAAPLQVMWAIRGTEEDALVFARERYGLGTLEYRMTLYGGSYAMWKLASLYSGKRKHNIRLDEREIGYLGYRLFFLRQCNAEEEMRELVNEATETTLFLVRKVIYEAGAKARRLVEDFPTRDSEKYAESAAPGLNYMGDLYVTLKEGEPRIAMLADVKSGLDAKTIVDNAIGEALNQVDKYSEEYKEDLYRIMALAPTIQ